MIYYKFLNPKPIYYFCEIDYIHKTEIFKDVVDYEGVYQVSDLGRVKSLFKDKILKSAIAKNGYNIVGLSVKGNAKTKYVHKLVAIAFLSHIPCGTNIVVDHINNIKQDNMLKNIRLVTSRENNSKDRIKTSSKYLGVFRDKNCKKFKASININGKNKHLGQFENDYEAHLAYKKALEEIK